MIKMMIVCIISQQITIWHISVAIDLYVSCAKLMSHQMNAGHVVNSNVVIHSTPVASANGVGVSKKLIVLYVAIYHMQQNIDSVCSVEPLDIMMS